MRAKLILRNEAPFRREANDLSATQDLKKYNIYDHVINHIYNYDKLSTIWIYLRTSIR